MCNDLKQLQYYLAAENGDNVRKITFCTLDYVDLDSLAQLDLPVLETVGVISGTCSAGKKAPCSIQWALSTTTAEITSTPTSMVGTTQLWSNWIGPVIVSSVSTTVILLLALVVWLIRKRRLQRARRAQEQANEEAVELIDTGEEEDEVVFGECEPVGHRTRSRMQAAEAAEEAQVEEVIAHSLVEEVIAHSLDSLA